MSDFWKPTAELFTALIEKPKMTEKLLQKPPFKYLFDIIAQTTKKTGFANGLYTGQELNAEFHSDKDKKILYLQKIIKVVELMSGAAVEAKPQRIVAGLDPEHTNEFLQLLHKCATSGKSSEPFVNKVLGKAEPEPEKKEPEKKEIKRPPSAARIKKPDAPAPAPAPAPASKKIVKQEEEEPAFVPPPPPVEQKPAKKEAPAAKQEYSKKVKDLMAEGEEEVVAQKETEKEEAKNKKEINLGKLGGKKKTKDTSEKIISSGGELTDKELELVQSMIQSICQNTAPLGKSIEFINDDIDAMNKELTFWRKQYNSSKAKTQNELKLTEEALMPIYDKIHEIQEQILDQKAKIQTTKAQILKNDSIVRDLLMSVVTTK